MIAKIASSLFCCVLLVSCGSHAKSRPQADEVRLATWNGAYAPLLAQSLGYYASEDLNVTTQDIPSVAKSMEALLGRSVDVVVGTYEQTIQMAAEGRGVESFMTLLNCHGMVLVVSPAAAHKIARIEDLKGAAIGVTSPGSSTQVFVNYLLRKHGVKPEDVSYASIGVAASAIVALERGQVDAGVIFGSAYAALRGRHPNLAVLANTYTKEGMQQAFGVDRYPSTALLARTEWLQQNKSIARKLAGAFQRTDTWMRNQSLDEIRNHVPEMYRMPDKWADIEWLGMLQPWIPRTGAMDMPSAEIVRNVLAGSLDSVRNAKIDLSKTFTNEFINER